MKRLLLLLLALALCSPISALSLDFQNYGDTTDVVCTGTATGSSCVWIESATGGNNYMSVFAGNDENNMINKYPSAITYAAATMVVSGGAHAGSHFTIRLYDSAMNSIYTYGTGSYSFPIGRYEVKVVGGTAYLYRDGVLYANSTPLEVNPSYIGFGAYQAAFPYSPSYSGWDDCIWGDLESKYILGMPETNAGGSYAFNLKKSIIDPASSGLENSYTHAIVNSYNMTTTFSKNNAASETMYLKHSGTGEIVGTETVSGYTGSVVWPLTEDVFTKITSAAPYGSYYAYLSGDTASLSPSIQYISGGAYIVFGESLYTTGDQATYSWNIDDDVYSLPYTFGLKIIDAYGVVHESDSSIAQSASGAYTWKESDDDGVYYIALTATDSGGNEIWLAYDYATVTGYLTFTGNVLDAETGLPIPVANVSFLQGTVVSNTNTVVDGNYTTGSAAFGAGLPIIFNISAPPNYDIWNFTMTPIATKTVHLDFSLPPLAWNVSGVALTGVVRDDTYRRPLGGVTVTMTNASHGTTHISVTNTAGGYKIDNNHNGTLISGWCYRINSTLTGYSQLSPSQMKCVV